MRTWGQGRELKSFDEITCKAKGTSLLSLSYTYDAAGNIQTVSKSGTVSYQYAYDELGQLIREDNKDANGMPNSVVIDDGYDVQTYCYVTNLQGDIVGLISAESGDWAVTYEYDVWGRLIGKDGTSSDYASIYEYNPLTYRGYIYDSETGFYYLQSRYYDPTVGRFLNADNVLFLGAAGAKLF